MSAPVFRIRQIIASEEDKKSLKKLESILEVSDIEKMFAAAFEEDVFTAAVIGMEQVGSSKELIGPFWKSVVIAGLLAGEVYVAETLDNHKVCGCAVWYAPGCGLLDSKEEQEMSLLPLMELVGKTVSDWWMTQWLPRYSLVTKKAIVPGKHAWHLQALAVHPDYQRRGIARQLVEIKRTDSDKSMMFLECQTHVNVEIYTHLGFKIMHQGNFVTDPGIDIDDYAEPFEGVQGMQFKMWMMGSDPQP